MRRLGRIGIFTSSISKFLVNLKRGHKELFDTMDEGIIDKYLSEKSLQCFSMVKPSESATTPIGRGMMKPPRRGHCRKESP
jgi:hypothetical protein